MKTRKGAHFKKFKVIVYDFDGRKIMNDKVGSKEIDLFAAKLKKKYE